MKFTARLMNESDIEELSHWATDNPDIPQEDKRVLDYPSAITICVEKDGKPIMYAPLHFQLFIGFLGFEPDMPPTDKARALKEAMAAARRLCKAMQVREIHVATKSEYPMGKWALKHGFKDSEKNDLYLEVNSV